MKPVLRPLPEILRASDSPGHASAPSSESDQRAWREYVFLREELRHEDNMLNARVSWLIGSQAFLLGGFAALVTAHAGASAPHLTKLQSSLLVGLPMAGTLGVAASYASILAAVIHIRGVRRFAIRKHVHGMPSLHAWQASVMRLGLVGPLITPLIFLGCWILILLRL